MPRRFRRAMMLSLFLALVLATALPGYAALRDPVPTAPRALAAGTITVDGTIDAAYGAAIATDPMGDGNGNAPMDLGALYLTDDSTNFYVAFTVHADLGTANWGKYVLYIDTTNDVNGATTDAWGRNVVVSDPHKPEFGVYTWVDAAPYDPADTQLVPWTGAAWDWNAAQSVGSAALGVGTPSTIEWRIPKAALGNPSQLWVEVWGTGGGGTDNAQDTINNPADDWNASDWSSLATLANSTPYTEQNPGGGGGGDLTCASGAAPDGDIWWNDLGHNSRDTLYRLPGGAVAAGTPVTLRLRAACNDLTGARLRVWNDRTDSQMMLDMTRAAHDTQYEWWEVTLPAAAEPTIYWYRFIAQDSGTVAYYEDDAARTGGWGQVFAESADNSYQLTIFDPTFETPDWVKNGIIYQIFVDRFRDGNAANNTPPGTFFYDTPGGTIFRSTQSAWHTPICDPRDPTSLCPGKYSENFYGGDLQGIVAKLDYLDDLGVTILYLNPIFEAPSNHKYDTRDYSVIDDNFALLNDYAASLALFQTLATEAEARGMQIVLDGVFNHTSSDSVYFDRYARYSASGACEAATSPYRDWYYFEDVPAGTGPCTSSTGTVEGANYESWFGYDSLPKLRANDQQVRDLIWAGGPSAIARYWLKQGADGWRLDVGGDVDAGVTNTPNNDYWEGFRDAVHASDPDGYIVGEEWGWATPWTLGQEWDATMNYQTSSAILSFWRDEPFVDNDHNQASSAGVLAPLTPAQLDERLHNIAERYPDEALYAMMNLLGSHDTNRPLFMLDHNTDLNDQTLYQNPAYDWSDAIQRLRGVVLLQMTLPGAPTIYYGDEVGLVGPVTYDGTQWQDDPYNRIPFPWLDESGTPFYQFLQTQGGQDEIRNYYKQLTGARLAHESLRTGSFDTLLVDNAANSYAYGRRAISGATMDAAVVILNRATSAQSISVDVSGYLPVGATLHNVLAANAPVTVDGSGQVTLNVPARAGALLVAAAPLAAPPAAATDLAVTASRPYELDLAWSAVAGADSYDLYRSLLSGGGYEFVANVAGTSYSDSGLVNAVRYHYVVVSRHDTTGLASGWSNEASGTPQFNLSTAWYNLQGPPTMTHTISTITPTAPIAGQLWIDGYTGAAGPAQGIRAEVGYGPPAIPPTDPSWHWAEMSYQGPAGNNDEYAGTLLPDQTGEYRYATRYSADNGTTWYYADLNGPGYDPASAGQLTVLPSSDTTAPAAPSTLTLDGTTPSSILFSWTANTEPDLAGYEIFRERLSAPGYSRLARVPTDTTSFVDDTVATGESYRYYVVAYDTSFNRSLPSNTIEGTAEARLVAVTFQVTVPAFTPGTVYLSREINPDGTVGGWNPAGEPLTQIDATTWQGSFPILDGTPIQFKFTRGSWDLVEKEADGNAEIPDRTITVDHGATGEQTIDLTVANWRDPIVVSHSPAVGATEVPLTTTIELAWSQGMQAAVTGGFQLEGPSGPVAGTFSQPTTDTLRFTPDARLDSLSTFTVTVASQVDAGGDVQQVPTSWRFTTRINPTAVTVAELGASRPARPLPVALLGATLLAGLTLAGWRRRRAA